MLQFIWIWSYLLWVKRVRRKLFFRPTTRRTGDTRYLITVELRIKWGNERIPTEALFLSLSFSVQQEENMRELEEEKQNHWHWITMNWCYCLSIVCAVAPSFTVCVFFVVVACFSLEFVIHVWMIYEKQNNLQKLWLLRLLMILLFSRFALKLASICLFHSIASRP